jgi:hypothetical protein
MRPNADPSRPAGGVHDTATSAPVQQATPDSLVEDVVLRDGSTLRLRAPFTPPDESILIDFFRSLSPDSRYLRFRRDDHRFSESPERSRPTG